MIWEGKPEFGDDLAKTKIRPHNTFGGKVIEILYGAKDAEGHAVAPKEGTEDGHGRWFGIEADGVYQMFVWQKPASEGGEIEYGTEYGDNAVEVMENQLRRRQAICREVEGLLRNYDDETDAKIATLKEEWDSMKNWNTPKDGEYADRFERSLGLYSRLLEDQARNREEKQAIVDKAKALIDSTSWKNTNEEFRTLQEEWKEIGSAGKGVDDELWNEFNGARKAFNTKRKEYFANRDAMVAEIKEKKENLIQRAKDATADVKNWRDAGNVINALMDEWKEIKGFGSRDSDEALWKEFNSIRQDFFARRRAFFNDRDNARKASVEKKKELIAKATEIVNSENYEKENTDAMKVLDKEWKDAGYSGKDDNDRLWNEFTAIKDQFWAAKRADNQKRFQDIIERKNTTIRNMKEQVNDLQERIFSTEDYTKIRNFERRIEEKKEIISNLEKDIDDLKKRLD